MVRNMISFVVVRSFQLVWDKDREILLLNIA